MAHSWGTINLDDINSEKGYNKNKAYSQSKLANILFTNLLAKRLEGHRYLSVIWLMSWTNRDCYLAPIIVTLLERLTLSPSDFLLHIPINV